MRLPGKLLLIAFCAALFTLITAVPPVRADHPGSAPYACQTLDAAMRTVAYVQAGELAELKRRAKEDETFKCRFVPRFFKLYVQEIVHAYVENGVQKVVVRAIAPDGSDTYLFATKTWALGLLHQD